MIISDDLLDDSSTATPLSDEADIPALVPLPPTSAVARRPQHGKVHCDTLSVDMKTSMSGYLRENDDSSFYDVEKDVKLMPDLTNDSEDEHNSSPAFWNHVIHEEVNDECENKSWFLL